VALKPLPKKQPGLSRKTKVVVAVISVLALAGGAWGVAAARSKDKKAEVVVPKEYTVEALKAKAAEANPGRMFEQMDQIRERKDLTDQQKHQIWENVHTVMEVRQEQRINAYFAAKPTEQLAMLDREIDRMVATSKQIEQRRAERPRNDRTPGGGSPVGVSGRPGGPAGPGGPGAGQPGGPQGRFRGTSTRLERKAHSESRNPDQHAREHAYRAALDQRAEQRGVQLPMRGPAR
jgi:hypothetical protein